MFDRITRSFELAKSSWNVLRADKKLVVFPVVSGVGVLIVLIGFVGPLAGLILGGQIVLEGDLNGNVVVPWWGYPLTFAFYFCNYFVIVFCNAALVSCALMRFNGEEPTVGDGFRAAAARLPQIIAWALVSATVGLILKVIENANEKIGEIVSAVLGTGWTVLTFFVVPVLVVEKVGPFTAVRRSLALLKKAWGEALFGNFSLGLFKLLVMLPGLLVLVAAVVLCMLVPPLALGLTVAALGVIYLLGAFGVCAALDAIFLTALYQYAAFEKAPAGFDRAAIAGAFGKKAA